MPCGKIARPSTQRHLVLVNGLPASPVGDLAPPTDLHLAPDWLQFDPRMGSLWANIGPQLAPHWHGLAQLGPKLFQHWPQIGAPSPGESSGPPF